MVNVQITKKKKDEFDKYRRSKITVKDYAIWVIVLAVIFFLITYSEYVIGG